jgi:hypothetical protein
VEETVVCWAPIGDLSNLVIPLRFQQISTMLSLMGSTRATTYADQFPLATFKWPGTGAWIWKTGTSGKKMDGKKMGS